MSHWVSHSFPSYDENIVEAALKALQDGNFSGIHIKEEAEQQLADFTNKRYAIIVSSGFSALQTALMALNVQKGQKVIIPTVTCPSVYHAVLSVGAEPVVTDVSENQPLMDLASIQKIYQGDPTKAIVIVPQMFGIIADLQEIVSAGFRIIEDAAQAFRPQLSSEVDLTVFSFSPTKLLTIGYAGAIVTDNEQYAQRMRAFLDPDHALFVNSNDESRFRIHAPITDFQCAMLKKQIERYESVIQLRKHLVAHYDQCLGKPERLNPNVPFRYQLLLRGNNTAEAAVYLKEKGISAYPLASHLLHHVFRLNGEYPHAERWYATVLSLPLHEKLTFDDVERISREVQSWL